MGQSAAGARILLTGAAGLLGQAVQAVAAQHGLALCARPRAALDISDAAAVAACLEQAQPTVVLNAAAYTDVDGAERAAPAAVRANGLGPAVLAAACAAHGLRLLHVSTDHVFDGRPGQPCRETDPTAPRSVYGASKECGEQWVQRLCPAHYVVRTAGLFGEGGRSFVTAILARARAGQPLRVVADQCCQRTYARDLAAACLELATGDAAFGTYHVTNQGAATWYSFAQEVLQAAGLTVPLTAVSSAAWGAAAWRPEWSVLDGSKWAATGQRPLRPVAAALAEHLARTAGRWVEGEEGDDA
ncbi:MAG: dTDP-4-dehydrorhamnose reductase [Fimbriimonadaceae bacterium]|nr:dTDP-4-dehydrorhamnose reductase [Fimbriimonadaceae bacterium]